MLCQALVQAAQAATAAAAEKEKMEQALTIDFESIPLAKELKKH